MYVCGITPYDATHLGHANTYVAFDLLNRAWRDAGLLVNYVQNVTDVDDPLIERADRDGVDWRELADSQIALFREDMEALNVLAPASYVGAVEAIPLIVELVERHQREGTVYAVDDPEHPDLYFEQAADPTFLSLSHLSPEAGAARVRRTGRRPRPARQARPARRPGLAPRATGRARLGVALRPRPARLAHRVHGDRARPAGRRPSTCRPAAATSSSRTTRCARARGS